MFRVYDTAGQLLQQKEIVIETGEVISQFDFEYDAVGNIIKEKTTPESDIDINLEMTYAAANRLATYDSSAVQLDADGNMTSGPLSGNMANFSFDSRNRLMSADETVYHYDAENQRIGVNQTQYVINSQPALSQVLVKTEADGTQTYYVYGSGLIGQEQDGEYLSYHFDFRGSTIALTDEAGQVIERFQYSPYGVLLSGEASLTPFLFNGKYGVMTDDNGLYYMRARFYSPEMRRFVNQDILLGTTNEGQSLNRYGYAGNNPIIRIDPKGKLWWWIPAIGFSLVLPSDTPHEHLPGSRDLTPEARYFVERAIDLIRKSGHTEYADMLTIMLQNNQIREFSPRDKGKLGEYNYDEIYISSTLNGFFEYARVLVHECAHKDDFSTGDIVGKNVLYMLQVLNLFMKYEDRSAEKYAFDEQAAFERDYKAWLEKEFRKKKYRE